MRPTGVRGVIGAVRTSRHSAHIGTPSPLCPHPTSGWWSRAWHLLFYGGLLFGLITASLHTEGFSTIRGAATLGLSALFAAWYWTWVVRDRLATRNSRAVYFTVSGLLWACLYALHPAYEAVVFSAVIQVTGYLTSRTAVPALIGIVALLNLEPLAGRGSLGPDDAISALITLALIALVILPMRAIHDESNRRQRLIDDLETARGELARSERRAGMLEERERLAGEIHDTVAQGLSSIVMLLQAARASLDTSASGAERQIEQAEHAARDNLGEVRRLVWALRPGALEKGTLADAVVRLGDTFRQSTTAAVTVDVVGDRRRLPTDVEVTLLRAAQELLSNIQQHAAATQVRLTLTYAPHAVRLQVHDDGIGLGGQPSGRERNGDRGLGLVVMRERVEALRGSLLVDSLPGSGTTVRIHVPLHGDVTAPGEPEATRAANGAGVAP